MPAKTRWSLETGERKTGQDEPVFLGLRAGFEQQLDADLAEAWRIDHERNGHLQKVDVFEIAAILGKENGRSVRPFCCNGRSQQTTPATIERPAK